MNQHLQPSIQLPNPHYFGGKGSSGTFQQIINFIRPHRTFIEGCAGNATIFRMKEPAAWTYLNDCDPAVIENLRNGLLSSGFVPFFWPHNYTEFFSDDRGHVVGLSNRDVIEEIGAAQFSGAGRDTVLYLDPPYPLASRKDPTARYTHEMTDDDHVFLLENAKTLKCDVLISTYPNELYAETLRSWHRHEFESSTRRGKATEWLFMNYDPSTTTELHDYRYWGENYRQRENNARKELRWAANFREESPIMQQKLLKALQREVDSSTGKTGGVVEH